MLRGPIFITGFMGAGKTRIGRLLARRLGRIFIDTDERVEARAGCSISEIFSRHGEEYFRRLERECVDEAAAHGEVVVALGGGAIVQQGVAERIRQTGLLVWLEADVETILERVSRRDDRPLLAGLTRDQKRERIQQMLEARLPYYRQAQIRIGCDENRTPEQTTEELMAALEAWSAQHRHPTG